MANLLGQLIKGRSTIFIEDYNGDRFEIGTLVGDDEEVEITSKSFNSQDRTDRDSVVTVTLTLKKPEAAPA